MATPTPATAPAPARGGIKNLLIVGIIGLLAASAGFALPIFIDFGAVARGNPSDKEKQKAEPGQAFVPFDDVVVNVNEERFNRLLMAKLIFVVDPSDEKEVTEAVAKKKPVLRNWIISYLSDKSIKELTGAAGIHRSRREIQDKFNSELFPDGSEKIRDVLVDKFNFQ
jgi:flagellar basal body-associated protein FliL